MLKMGIRRIWRTISPGTRAKLVRATHASFTVSTAAVVVNENREVLLLNHVLRPYSGWGFPGGFVDRGEQVEDAIRRELLEEAGIELFDLRLVETNTYNKHIEILWSARTNDHPEVKSAEIIELGWFNTENLPAELGKNQVRQINEILAEVSNSAPAER